MFVGNELAIAIYPKLECRQQTEDLLIPTTTIELRTAAVYLLPYMIIMKERNRFHITKDSR